MVSVIFDFALSPIVTHMFAHRCSLPTGNAAATMTEIMKTRGSQCGIHFVVGTALKPTNADYPSESNVGSVEKWIIVSVTTVKPPCASTMCVCMLPGTGRSHSSQNLQLDVFMWTRQLRGSLNSFRHVGQLRGGP